MARHLTAYHLDGITKEVFDVPAMVPENAHDDGRVDHADRNEIPARSTGPTGGI
jgi:hypothetical protein